MSNPHKFRCHMKNCMVLQQDRTGTVRIPHTLQGRAPTPQVPFIMKSLQTAPLALALGPGNHGMAKRMNGANALSRASPSRTRL